jgi:hypothetical protein
MSWLVVAWLVLLVASAAHSHTWLHGQCTRLCFLCVINTFCPANAVGLRVQALHELAGGELAGAAGGRGGPSSLQQETLDFVQQQSMVVSHGMWHLHQQICF